MEYLKDLNSLLDELEFVLAEANLSGEFDYRFRMGFVDDVSKEYDRSRPSFNMVLTFNKRSVAAINYEIDKRFSNRIRHEERGRIKNVLARELTTMIGLHGVLNLILGRIKKNEIITRTYKEEDEKFSFGICLN
jgi:hypothetical protein